MNTANLLSNWALIAGIVILVVAAFALMPQLYARTARGQLRKTRATMTRAKADHKKLHRQVADLEKQVDRLAARGESVKPRVLREKREQLEDARSLEKIAGDNVLVTQNHVRRVIVEEFPPKMQERLRSRILPPDDNNKPFSF